MGLTWPIRGPDRLDCRPKPILLGSDAALYTDGEGADDVDADKGVTFSRSRGIGECGRDESEVAREVTAGFRNSLTEADNNLLGEEGLVEALDRF